MEAAWCAVDSDLGLNPLCHCDLDQTMQFLTHKMWTAATPWGTCGGLKEGCRWLRPP